MEVGNVRLNHLEENETRRLISTTGGTTDSAQQSKPQDFSYNYVLNHQKQIQRLITNANKPPLSITYNNFKVVDGIQHGLNAIIECNSGVYLSAIKPVLECVNIGWFSTLDAWTVSCSKLSNRQDSTNVHHLCTQLTLVITASNLNISHQATLHFYHTKDKILIQGSSMITPGMSSATWLVKNLLEPLAASHIASNQESISQINSAIMSWLLHQELALPR